MSDILDEEEPYVYSNVDSKINPLTNLPFSRNYYKLRDGVAPDFRGWGKFSSQVNKQDLLDKLEKTNIILLTGETGSGKTTQIPKILYEYLEFDKTVLCTQPRRVTTSLIATRVAEELDVKLGSYVGFRYQGSEKEKGGDIYGLNKLYYMTDGTFASFILPNPGSLAYYGAVIIDEAHVRNVAIDTLLYLIRQVLRENPFIQTKFIVMSATVDKDIFMNYFKKEKIIHHHLAGATQYPIKDVYLDRSVYEGTKIPLMHVPWHLKRIVGDIYGIQRPQPQKRDFQRRDQRDQRGRRDRRDFQQRRDRKDFQQRRDRKDFQQRRDQRDQRDRRDFQQRRDQRDRRDFQQRRDQRDRRDFQQRRDKPRFEDRRDVRDIPKPRQDQDRDRPPRDMRIDSPRKEFWKKRKHRDRRDFRRRGRRGRDRRRRDIRFGPRPPRSESEERSGIPLIEDGEDESLAEMITESELSFDQQEGGAEETPSPPDQETTPSPVSPKKPEGDILVFLPTIRALSDMLNQIEKFLEQNNIKNYKLLTVSGQSSESEKNQAQKAIPGITKIVFATDVAETGITIENLSYVIDTGIRNQVEYDIKEKATRIGINYISKAAARQRRGRTGRRQPGTCFRLYTKEEHDKFFEDHPKPDILVNNNDSLLLELLFYSNMEPSAIVTVKKTMRNFLTPLPEPTVTIYINRFKQLKWLGTKHLTMLGECAQGSGFRNAVDLVHVYLLFYAYNLETPMMADLTMMMEIANRMSVREYLKYGKEGLPEEFKAKYMNKYGDLMGLYHIYLDYMNTRSFPKKYKEFINEERFKDLYNASNSLLNNIITANRDCHWSQKRKYKLSDDESYTNYVSAFRQTYEENEVLGKDLNFNPQRDITFIEGGIQPDKKYFYLDKTIFMQFGKELRRNYSMIFTVDEKLTPSSRKKK